MHSVVFNQKGGVGKSTIACNLAAISAIRGRDTVILDLDPQGNSSRYLLGSAAEESRGDGAAFFEQMLSFSFREQPLESFLRPTPFEGLRILYSSPELDELESKLESRYKTMKLRESHSRASPMIHLDPTHKVSRELEALYDALCEDEAAGAE